MGSSPARGATRAVEANSKVQCQTAAKLETNAAIRDETTRGLTDVWNVAAPSPASTTLTTLRLQFTSDLHLEFLGASPDEAVLHAQLPEPAAPNLALLGDIGDPFSEVYQRTIALLAKQWQTVIVLAGNHEYYQAATRRTMSEVNLQIAAVCDSFPNVHFLNDGELCLDGIRLLGTTLWSALPEASRAEVKRSMNDCRMIFVGKENQEVRPVTPEELHGLHVSSTSWLHSALSAPVEQTQLRTVVLSHHAPSRAMLLGSKCNGSSLLAHAFFTDMEELMSDVAAWLSGHVHYCTSQYIGPCDTLCACNAVGYPNARRLPPGSDDPRYSKKAVLVVPSSGKVQLERPPVVRTLACEGDEYMAEFIDLFDDD